jgi:egghead protein (zeste-white 4 protein)
MHGAEAEPFTGPPTAAQFMALRHLQHISEEQKPVSPGFRRASSLQFTRPENFGQVVDLELLQRIAYEQASAVAAARLPPLVAWAPGRNAPVTADRASHTESRSGAAGRKAAGTPARLLDFRHRMFILVGMVCAVGTLYGIQRSLWPVNHNPHTWEGTVWSAASVIWLAAFLPAVAELAGLLMYRHPRYPITDQHIPQFVCWRIVSRGTNTEALTATILRCRREMQATPLFRYVIEVVTDVPNPALPARADDLAYLTVPRSYQTVRGSLFKARALQYALQFSPLSSNAWIVHLDEETHPTESGIRGIAKMIKEEESDGRLRIGQGTILYHRSWREHPFLTLADMPRTGDDLGRFHLAHRSGVTLFGLHGSYIVVRNDVEKQVGFDFGPVGSITEDAFWALASMQLGYRCRWVDGYLEEQSTQSVRDFMKQRRRWFQGIVKVCLHAPVKLKWRIVLSISTVLWTLAPVSIGFTILHFITGGSVNPVVTAMADMSFASFIITSLAGLRVNLAEHGIENPVLRFAWSVAFLLCMPLFSVIEAGSVAYAIVSPSTGFHVVKK